MEGFPPSSAEDDVMINLTSNQFDIQSPEDSFNISELLSSPLEDLANQSFISCNDQVEQNFVVDNNVINDSIQQTTQFPPSSSQAIMEGVTASSIVDDVNLRSNESDGRPQLLLYVILKHMLSEDDYLQLVFVQFSLLFPKKTTMLLPIEAGRRFQAMIKVDRTT
ncbi:uncharacterized protein LOC18108035 [Populus trichocarpa]|uniref:uncharacterized protein LOC18108035 n=1 Tax=Populus trichocarpa TaxID=3694 RepID=UPI00227871EC|nr:uncharacterized protein LOC18108035 [Populus trichocarpa]